MRTTILLEHEPSPAGHLVRALLRLEAEPPPAADRPSLNLSLVLDRSGSMAGEKLAAAREAASLLVRQLALQDVVSVVAYDDQVSVVSSPTTGAADQGLAGRIGRIPSGGSTNLSGGWLRGREFVKDGLKPLGVNRVLLLTDGLANIGITDPEQLVAMCQGAKREGVTTTTIGFGEDYDEQLLRAMADAGGGNTYYIERPDQAPAVFGHELEGLLGIAAQNVRAEVRAAPAVQLAQVHHDYPTIETPEHALRLDLGDLYAREPKALLCDFLVSSDAAPSDSVPVAVIVITADVVVARGIEHQRIELPITVSTAEGPRVDAEIRRELLLLEAAKARREALDAQAAGDYALGSMRLEQARTMLEELGADDEVMREEADDLKTLSSLYDLQAVSPADRKYMYQRAYNQASGRAASSKLIRRKKGPQEPA